MENTISASQLNDFIFCPASIYFHRLFGDRENILFQNTDQINGTASHVSVDENKYSTSAEIHTSIEAYSEKYNLVCCIDIYNSATGELTERKKKIKTVYDGYVYQIYAQCFAMREMGFHVTKLRLHSMDDNKNYPIQLPEDNPDMMNKFEALIIEMQHFDIESFVQTNLLKCEHCIYEPSCDRSLLGGDNSVKCT